MQAQDLDDVVDNGDGTFTIVDPTDDGDWLIYDTGEGWTSAHPNDGWEGDPRWADAFEASAAILGDPYATRMWSGELYVHWAAANGMVVEPQ